jgi:hypothetical protein
MSARQKVRFAGLPYEVEVIRRREEPPEAPRLIAVCYNSTGVGVDITRVCVESVLRHTPGPYELWVVDNASPPQHSEWLRSLEGVNVVLNHTPPVPKESLGWQARLGLREVGSGEQMSVGSYANAIGLELGAWAIDPAAQQVFVMHNDVLVLRDHWLAYLQSKLSERVRAVAVRRDTSPRRIGALHVSGLLFDFTLFRELGMSFMPAPPRIDVGDRISATLRAHGYEEFVCRNTHNEPDLAAWIAEDDPVARLTLTCRTFDDDQNVIYAHLGRGTPKAAGTYWKTGRTTPEQWIAFAEEMGLAESES